MGRSKKELGSIGTQYGKTDLVRMGLFSEAQYISSGEQYNTKKGGSTLDYRTKGKQFLTAPPKKGHDDKHAYFDKEFVRVFENEPYTDLVVLRRRWRLQAKDKNITPQPFKPSSVPPKPSGKGSTWGTIEQQFPTYTKLPAPAAKPAPESKKQPELKNFLTAPPKKGSGYGYPSVTIGKSYEYVSDPYNRSLDLERQERSENIKKMVGARPFIASTTGVEFFNPFAGLTKIESAQDQEKNQQKHLNPPFKPSSTCGSTINPYPTYEPPKAQEDPNQPKPQAKQHLIFKPSGVTGSYPIRSIIESTIPKAPPQWLQETIKQSIASQN
ncbi:hypothetical protein EDD86DRAFT_209408 [Gorgonomyces haynaldii]|nr:hypothetical protein EDD86DRAFT_209408 [Gorgonomyces haynaldii]